MGVDVDQEVPAAEDVELREGRIDEDVLRCKTTRSRTSFLIR